MMMMWIVEMGEDDVGCAMGDDDSCNAYRGHSLSFFIEYDFSSGTFCIADHPCGCCRVHRLGIGNGENVGGRPRDGIRLEGPLISQRCCPLSHRAKRGGESLVDRLVCRLNRNARLAEAA